MEHAKHGFTETVIDHHDDGSHTMHHIHKDGSEHDHKYAVEDIDSMHDGLESHLGEPNPGEEAENHEDPAHMELLEEIELLLQKFSNQEHAEDRNGY
jgi:hypothetical protein